MRYAFFLIFAIFILALAIGLAIYPFDSNKNLSYNKESTNSTLQEKNPEGLPALAGPGKATGF